MTAWDTNAEDIVKDIRTVKEQFARVRGREANVVVAAPHSAPLCMLDPAHMLDCRPCLDRDGLWIVRYFASSGRPLWNATLSRVLRALPHPLRFPPAKRLPLP